jgi:hypothetical protein
MRWTRRANVVSGIVNGRVEAERLVSQLHAIGFRASDISVAAPCGCGEPDGDVGGKVAELRSGGLGLLSGFSLVAVPRLGLLVVAGPLMAALGGALVGPCDALLVAPLITLGIPEPRAWIYDQWIRSRRMIVVAHSDHAHDALRGWETFDMHRAADVFATPLASKRPTPQWLAKAG